MASAGVVTSLVYLLVLLPSLNTATSAKETYNDNNSGVSNTQSKRHNVYTSNNFYAGPNKKIETLLLDVKKELGEMREEIKTLKENKTGDKSKQGNELCTKRIMCAFISLFSKCSIRTIR